jgi:hypothetical protein
MRVVKVVTAVWLGAVLLRDTAVSICNRFPTFRKNILSLVQDSRQPWKWRLFFRNVWNGLPSNTASYSWRTETLTSYVFEWRIESRVPNCVKLHRDDGRKGWRSWNFLSIGVAWEQIVQDGHVKLNPGLAWQFQHSARWWRFFSPADWTLKAETSERLHLEQSFVCCWNFDTSERSYMSGTFSDVMPEKYGEDLLGPILWNMKYYIESRRKGISYIQ